MSTIKVVFSEEVRRVQVAGAVSAASYLKLEETIKNLFPVLKDTHFVLVWQDDEGDKVSVSSGSEFFEALQVMSYARGVPRFTIKPTAEKTQVVHSSVTCDECGVSPIRGDRFKCTVRNDFDLCKGCEARRTQPYPMIKIADSAPLYRVSPFGCRAAQRGPIRECVRGPKPQFKVAGFNPLGFPLLGRHPVGISFVAPPQQQRTRHCLFSPCNRPAPNTQSTASKESEEVQLDAEVLSFLQAIGAVPRDAVPQQTSQTNTSSAQSATSAASAAPEKKESAAAQDRLESELTSLLQAIFSGQQPIVNSSSAAPNSNSSSNSSPSNTASQSSGSNHGATRDLNDEDEALQRAIRESLRVAAEGTDKQQQREEQHDQEEEEDVEDVEDVWSESDSVSSGDFQVVGSSGSVADQSAPVAEPVPVTQPVATGPTEDELLSLWSHELALLASMGFSDPLALLPLLQTHVGSPASTSSSSSSSDDGAASAYHPEGLQRVVGELIRGKF